MFNRMGHTLRMWGTSMQLRHLTRLAYGKAKQAIRQQGRDNDEAWVCIAPITGVTVVSYKVLRKVILKLRKRGYHAMEYPATWIRIFW